MGHSLAARQTPAGLRQGFTVRSSPSGTLRALLILPSLCSAAASALGGAARVACPSHVTAKRTRAARLGKACKGMSSLATALPSRVRPIHSVSHLRLRCAGAHRPEGDGECAGVPPLVCQHLASLLPAHAPCGSPSPHPWPPMPFVSSLEKVTPGR